MSIIPATCRLRRPGPCRACLRCVRTARRCKAFTSQGCSESPKADAMLEDLTRRGDVLTLAYHVNYWDYIGWPDEFGRREFTEHQQSDMRRASAPPQAVHATDGGEWPRGIVGSPEADVEQSLEHSLPLAVALVPEGDVLGVSIPANPAMGRASVWLVAYLDRGMSKSPRA